MYAKCIRNNKTKQKTEYMCITLISAIQRPEQSHIHMFLGLPEPEPDPLVKDMDPDPGPSIIRQK